MNVKMIFFLPIFMINSKFILVKMKLRIDDNDNQTGPLALLKTWRDKKYQEIDDEYNRKVDELKKKISKHDTEISQTISNIQELLNEGDVSIDQVKQIQKTIETLTNQVNNLLITKPIEPTNESNLVGTSIHMGGLQYLVKARIHCNKTDLYALESEKALIGYNGLCPQCNQAHVLLEPNRGMYALCKTLHAKIQNLN